VRKWELLRRLQRGDKDRFRGGTDERPARPRMTGDGHPYLWEELRGLEWGAFHGRASCSS
jgi:hypothetical protein